MSVYHSIQSMACFRACSHQGNYFSAETPCVTGASFRWICTILVVVYGGITLICLKKSLLKLFRATGKFLFVLTRTSTQKTIRLLCTTWICAFLCRDISADLCGNHPGVNEALHLLSLKAIAEARLALGLRKNWKMSALLTVATKILRLFFYGRGLMSEEQTNSDQSQSLFDFQIYAVKSKAESRLVAFFFPKLRGW